ncbi:MAG: YtxH domain-containing protein [Actinomycetota bacterium]
MEDSTEEHRNSFQGTKSMLIGLLVGGLAGAGAMLLFAPQSGEQTRSQIREKSLQLRDQTTAGVKHVLEQARIETEGMTAGVREKAGELKHLGQDKLVRQMDRVSDALDAGKKAVKAA